MSDPVPADAGPAAGAHGTAPVSRRAPVRGLSGTVLSLWIWTGTALIVLLWLPLIALRRLTDRTPARRPTSELVRRLNLFINRVNPLLRVRVEGFSNLRPGTCYLVVCNHQSLADIPLLARMPFPLKWVAKKDLFRVPVTGWIMRMAGDIPVSRGVPGNRESVLARAGAYLQAGMSVLFFPEGRRTGDGAMGRFSRGAFELAVSTGATLLPVVIDGLWTLLPASAWRFGHAGMIRLRVLPPIDTRGLVPGDEDALRAGVRRQMIQTLAEFRGVSPGEVDGIERAAQARRTQPG